MGCKLARAAVALVVFACPTLASATVDYDVIWTHGEYKNAELFSSESVQPSSSATHFFSVNQTPIPFRVDLASYVQFPNGDEYLTIHNPFSSVLLQPGDNEVTFGVSIDHGDNTHVHSIERATLTSPVITPRKLFNVERHGNAYTGATRLAMTLGEINPPLAKDIARLEAALASDRKLLVANAADVADLARKLTFLDKLEAELSDLATRHLDDIRVVDLDAILVRYEHVIGANARVSLNAVVSNLKKSVVALATELERLYDAFGKLAEDAANVVVAKARAAGWNPDDANNYTIASNLASVADIPLPDISKMSGAFDPGKDPYAAYADNVIGRLNSTLVKGDVSFRGEFASIVRGWRRNRAALEKALRERANVSQKETAAFLRAENRVTTLIARHMDSGDWFIRTPVSPALRALVDGIVAEKLDELARTLKDHLNEWPQDKPSASQTILDETIRGLASGMQADDFDDIAQFDTRPMMRAALADASTAAKQLVGAVVGALPLGPLMWACQAITGWDLCNNVAAKKLSTSERVQSGLSAAISSATFWRFAVGSDEVSTGLAAISTKMERLSLADRLVLRAKVGTGTMVWFDKTGDEAFIAFANAALGKPNPIMKSASITTANALNARMIAASKEIGWVTGTNALTGTSVGGEFVRVFRKVDRKPASGQWMTMASEVRGLTREQIQAKLGLPSVPDRIVDVTFPAGESINVGIAGPNGFGTGGGLQIFWAREGIDWKTSAAWFTNERAL